MTGNIHLKQSLKGIWWKALLLFVGLFLFEMLFSILATSAQVQAGILKDLEDIPPVVEKMMGEGFVEALIKYGVIAVGYLHPFMIILFIVFIFLTVSHMLTSEINDGTIGFTLSKPLSRIRIYINLMIVVYSGLAFLALSTYLASSLGVVLLHNEKLTTAPFASLSWNIFLIMIYIAGYVTFFASLSDSSKKLYTYAGLTLLVFYLLTMATPLWKPLEFISPVNPFTYYNPMAMLMGSRISNGESILIISVSLLMFAAATWIFKRRDLASG
jgi:ABC-type transport system involved in multi-copper enzyme maturation permease subunit